MSGAETEEARLDRLLAFWFAGASETDAPKEQVRFWFGGSPAADAGIEADWKPLVEDILADRPVPLPRTAHGQLGRILLLDQFPRNLYRGTARAFAGDARALVLARGLVGSGELAALTPIERIFVLMPFEHSESLAVQHESVALFEALVAETGSTRFLDLALLRAREHRDDIARFGRYPYRNAALGRASTPEEIRWLEERARG